MAEPVREGVEDGIQWQMKRMAACIAANDTKP